MQEFQDALAAHKEELQDDPVVHAHLSVLYDTLLQENLVRLIEPFSRVEIQHVAGLIKLPLDVVLAKLSQVGLSGCLLLVTVAVVHLLLAMPCFSMVNIVQEIAQVKP